MFYGPGSGHLIWTHVTLTWQSNMPTPTRKSRGTGSPIARACVSMPHICETDAGCRKKCKGLFKTINMASERSPGPVAGSEPTLKAHAMVHSIVEASLRDQNSPGRCVPPWNISKWALSGDKAARFVSGWCKVFEQTRGWKEVSAGVTVWAPAVSIPFDKRFKPNSCSKYLIYCLCFHSNTAVKFQQAAHLPYLSGYFGFKLTCFERKDNEAWTLSFKTDPTSWPVCIIWPALEFHFK